MERRHILQYPFLDRVLVKKIFEKYNDNDDYFIYFIYGVHWVALTPTQYSDDSKHYDVSNFKECIKNLQNMLPILPNKGAIDSSGDTIDSSSDTTNPESFTHMKGSRFTMNKTYDTNMSIQSRPDPIKKSPNVQSSRSNERTSPNVSEDIKV